MLSPTCVLWDVGYPVYAYGSIFIIALILWQVKRRRGLRLGPKRCFQCHRRIKPKSKDRMSRAKKISQEETKKLQELLSVMKSQGLLPQKRGVRRLLCADPSCQICNGMALEVQQLLGDKSSKTSLPLLRPSQSSSCLEMSMSGLSFEHTQEIFSRQPRDLSLVFGPTPTQLSGQQSLIQSAVPSIGDVHVKYYLSDHFKQEEEFHMPGELPDMEHLSSSSHEEHRSSRQKRKNSTKFVRKNQEDSEVDMGSKTMFFSHWINPEVKCERYEEPIFLSNAETLAKPRMKVKSTTAIKDQVRGGNLEKLLKAQPPPASKSI
uniref:protein FAM205C n=1 Tax=Jaculus jaculus TaxID=51337 RepID=UPI001E1B3D14|nr:protein FAM205C [Jaculus jaculus]